MYKYFSFVGESKLPEDAVLTLTSSDQAASTLLASSQDEQKEAVEIEDVPEHSQPA